MSLAALASLCAVSCSEDGSHDIPDNSSVVTITSSQITHEASAERVWKSNDRVGVYQFNGESLLKSNIQYCNVALDGESASFKAVNSDEAVEYIAGSANVMAYYPYNADVVDGLIALDLSTQLNAESIDLIAADRTTLTSAGATELEFVHKLAMLRFNIECGADITYEELSDLELSISGLYVTGNYDLINGTIQTEEKSEVSAIKTADGGYTIELVVLPQSGSTLELVFQSSSMGVSVQSATISGEIPTAEVYEYTATVNKTSVEISSVTITPWSDSGLSTDGGVTDVTGNPYFDDVSVPEAGFYYYANGSWSSVDDYDNVSFGGANSVVGMIYSVDTTNAIAYVLSIQAPFEACNWAEEGYYYVDDAATDSSNVYNTGVNTFEANTGAQNMAAVKSASEQLSPAGSVVFNGYPAFQNVHSLNDESIDYSEDGMLYDFWYMTNTAEARVAVAWIIANWDNINTWFDSVGRSNGSSFPTQSTSRYWGAADEDGYYNTFVSDVVDKYRTMSIYPNSAYTSVTYAQQIKGATNYTLPIMQVKY